jgi:PKD repeat protein
MKKIKNRKKIIKEASVLFIAAILIFSSVVVMANNEEKSVSLQWESKTQLIPENKIRKSPSSPLNKDIVWNNGLDTGGNAYSSQRNNIFISQIVDDFTFSEETTIDSVHWWGAIWNGPPDEVDPIDFEIYFYADDGTGNAPTGAGMPDPSSTALEFYTFTGVTGLPLSSNNNYEYEVDIPDPFVASAGEKYWIAIVAALDYPPQWGWINTDEIKLHSAVMGFPALNPPVDFWTDIDPAVDMAFYLTGTTGGGPLVANANGPYDGLVGEEIAFTGSASGGVLPFSFEWDFGDGITSSLQNPVHFYVEEGEYDVVLTVTDDEQNQAVATTTATISKEFNWVHYDDGENVFSIGLMGGGSFEWGIRLTPEELTGYDGEELTTVRFHHGEAGIPEPEHTGNIYIYEGGTPTSPGQIIPEATTPWTHNGSGWVEITLASPVFINESHDLWITLDVTHADGENPAGVADGPSIPGKSCLITIDGEQWFNLIDLVPNLDYNWNLWAGFENDSIPLITSANGPYEGVVGEEIAFTGSVVGGVSPYSFEWTFGDGIISSDQNPEHIYSEDGIFEVTLTVTDGDQNIAMNTTTATIVEGAGEPELLIGKIMGGLAKIDAEIKNIGDTEASNVTCRISVSGGLLKLIDKNETIQIPDISANKIKIASIKPIIGLGKISINVTASAEGLESVSKEIEGRVFFFFVLIS